MSRLLSDQLKDLFLLGVGRGISHDVNMMPGVTCADLLVVMRTRVVFNQRVEPVLCQSGVQRRIRIIMFQDLMFLSACLHFVSVEHS